MEQTSIEEIPEEVLVKIFEFVDKKTLKNVALTCKTWRDLSNEVSWFMHLRLKNHDYKDKPWLYKKKKKVKVEDWSSVLLLSSRRLLRLKISECDEWESNNLLEICKEHGGRVQELRIFNSRINESTIFIDILKAMPNLKKCIMLNVSTVRPYIDPKTAEDLPIFEKLEILEMVNCSNRILKCFQKSQLSTLKLFGSRYLKPAIPLLKFLTTQKSLKTLALRLITAKSLELFKTPVDEIPFKLSKLSLLGFELRNHPNDYNNLLKFLQTHAETLVELEIGKKFPDFIFEYIISKFNQLQSLKVSIHGILCDMALYDRLEVNTSVTKLIVSGGYPHDEYLKALMRHFPNVESLIFNDGQSTDTMQFASTNFLRLRYLKVMMIKDAVSFPNLETLHVQNYYDQNDWAGFAAVNRGIKDLMIEVITGTGETAKNLLEGITDNLKLQVLRLGQGITLDKEFFDNIRQNCVDLKVMRVHKDSLIDVDLMKVKDIPALTIYKDFEAEFPEKDDGKIWNDEEYDEMMPEDGEENEYDSMEDTYGSDESYYGF